MAGDRPFERAVLSTPWRREFATPVRAFLRTESGSAGILVAAIALGLVWANLGDSYERVWTTPFGFRLGDSSLTRELRTWVDTQLGRQAIAGPGGDDGQRHVAERQR